MADIERLMSLNGVETMDKPDYSDEIAKRLDAIMEFMGVSGRWDGRMFVVEQQEKESGDYTNPIQIIQPGVNIEVGKWYYTSDRDLPHQAKVDAFVSQDDFFDTQWFEFID